jgi:multisubunit Na+/H+ antiporter MnhB subunit
VGAAIVAIETRSLLSAVIGLGAVGFGLSLAFLLLRAPDIAIVQVVVEVITLVFLIRATLWHGIRTTEESREMFGVVMTAALLLVMLLVLIGAIQVLPTFGEPRFATDPASPAAGYLASALERTGASNAVTAVILDFRAYDTLGEATVLFAAVLGVVVVLRTPARRDEGTDGGAS